MASSSDPNKKLSGLQGPKPPPLRVCKSSSRIKKQSTAHSQAPYRPPVIIYVKSPEIIHVDAQNFMHTVQRLTGNSSSSSSSPLQVPCSRDLVKCSSSTSAGISDRMGGGVEQHSNSEVDHMLLVHEMCSWGLPPPPLLPSPSHNSPFPFPSPNLYPDFYDFPMIPDTPYNYHGSSHASNQ